MAPKKAPRSAPASAARAAAKAQGKSSGGESGAALTPHDIDQAKEDALLQLRIGRSAHYYAVVVSGALLIDALLVLFFPPKLGAGAVQDLRDLYFLAFPLAGGLYLAAFGLRVKWEDYQLWPWENHFSLTLASVGIDALLVYLYVAVFLHYGPTGHWTLLPWFYSATLVGVTLPLVALALTWTEWGPRKLISLAAAIAPAPLALVLGIPSLSGASQLYALAISLSASAVLFQMAGSFLHLIASGTRPHEREVLTSGQNRLFQVAAQLRTREEALKFREETLVGREADAENAELAMRRKLDALEESRAHVAQLDADVGKRAAAITDAQRDLAVKAAEANARARSLESKESALKLREQDLATRLPGLAEREKELVGREGSLAAKAAELDSRGEDLERRLAEAKEQEGRLKTRELDIERKTSEVMAREGGLGGAGAGGRRVPAAPRPGSEEEARLARLANSLDQQNKELGRKAAQAKAVLEQVEGNRKESARMVEALKVREGELARREREASEKLVLAESRMQKYDAAAKSYEEKMRAAETRSAQAGQTLDEATRREQSLKDREGRLAAQETTVKAQRAELDALEQKLNVKEKRLTSLEDELTYRDQALSQIGGPGAEGLSLAFAAAAEGGSRAPALPPLRRRLPAPSESAEAEGVVDEALQPATGLQARFPDRLPTGTRRLDDLLLGGIPPGGHLMLIGDAFVGKEIAVYAFLAEGLKRSEPVVIITAARGPDELSQKIGQLAPQFREYEQLGRVHWIDASVPEGAQATRSSTANRITTNGPQDLQGILSALVKSVNALTKEPAPKTGAAPIRVAFLGLSATLSHADERQRLQFVQNVVGVLKPRKALGLYTLETGTLPDTQMETILSGLDGAIYFKREGDKTFLSVQGVGEIQTRQWVEYRATNRGIVIGSFSLERIR